MAASLSPKFSNKSHKWVQLFPLYTSSISALTENPTQTTHPHDLSILKSLTTDHNQLKQTISHMITHNIPINQCFLMNLIDASVSSFGFASSSLLFPHFQHFLNSDLCSSIVKSYTNSNKHLQSILVFNQMHKLGILPDYSAYPAVIKSVAQLWLQNLGKLIHGYLIRMGFQSDIYSNTALVNMYSTCRCMREARQLFDEMPERNSVSWNALITGYVHNRNFRAAISMFRIMQLSGAEPGEVTMVGVLSACAHLGALNQGVWIHNYINQNRLRLNVFVGTALIDMYAKCGVVNEAEKVFRAMRMKNVYTWNVLISGFALNGQGETALQKFSEMVMENFKPDGVTFLAILLACGHQGLVEEGRRNFARMGKEYGLKPRIEHYGCMVDLLARAGFLDEAQELIKTMPMKPDPIIWRALLGACRIYGNTKLGELAIGNLLDLEPNNFENYVLLSNLYARDQKWTKVGEVREMMKRKGIKKVPGCSSIEVNNAIYEFVVSESNDRRLEEVYKMLADMDRELKLAGYVMNTDLVSYDIEEEEKESSLMYHSEKLALAFGLLRTSSDSTIRIVKNLRVCKDCHDFFKLVSMIYKRDITVRDRTRFHHFVRGYCSCKNYW